MPESSRIRAFRARRSAGRRPRHRCGACRRPAFRKAGRIPGRNSRPSGGGSSAPFRRGRRAVRRVVRVAVAVVVPGRVARQIVRRAVPVPWRERRSVRCPAVARPAWFGEPWVAQAVPARGFDSFPFCLILRLQTKPAGFENMRSVFAGLRRGRLRPAAACGSGYDVHKKGCPYRATGHNKENKGLVSSRLLIGRVKMEPDREVARRKPPAAGLAACLRRDADDRLCSHK